MRLVPKELAVCAAWHARGFENEPIRGDDCRECSRAVAVPISAQRREPVCLYCALDLGIIAAVEREPGQSAEEWRP